MKRIVLFIFLFIFQNNLKAQDAERLHSMGKNYLIDGDFSNAESMLTRAYALDSTNISIIKDLTLCYYFEKDFIRALSTIKPSLDNETADDQCYQIAGNIYKGLNQIKECEELYLKAIKKFSKNGALYNELGELMSSQNNIICIEYWENGIEYDPEYSKNYYSACKYYAANNENLWCIIYGEIFVNMEPMNSKTPQIKDMMIDAYKKLYTTLISEGAGKEKNKFVQKVIANLAKENNLASQGINASSLTMIRTKFILDWYNDKTEKYPYKLFEYHQQLLRDGMFEAYNQWLYGSSENLIAFQNWTQLHSQDYTSFIKYMKSNQFKMPKGQYYH